MLLQSGTDNTAGTAQAAPLSPVSEHPSGSLDHSFAWAPTSDAVISGAGEVGGGAGDGPSQVLSLTASVQDVGGAEDTAADSAEDTAADTAVALQGASGAAAATQPAPSGGPQAVLASSAAAGAAASSPASTQPLPIYKLKHVTGGWDVCGDRDWMGRGRVICFQQWRSVGYAVSRAEG